MARADMVRAAVQIAALRVAVGATGPCSVCGGGDDGPFRFHLSSTGLDAPAACPACGTTPCRLVEGRCPACRRRVPTFTIRAGLADAEEEPVWELAQEREGQTFVRQYRGIPVDQV